MGIPTKRWENREKAIEQRKICHERRRESPDSNTAERGNSQFSRGSENPLGLDTTKWGNSQILNATEYTSKILQNGEIPRFQPTK